MYILFRFYIQFYLFFIWSGRQTWILMIKVYVTAMKKGMFKLKTGSLYYSFPPSIYSHNDIHNYILCECMNNKNYCIQKLNKELSLTSHQKKLSQTKLQRFKLWHKKLLQLTSIIMTLSQLLMQHFFFFNRKGLDYCSWGTGVKIVLIKTSALPNTCIPTPSLGCW